jgi:hypothetical protein
VIDGIIGYALTDVWRAGRHASGSGDRSLME